MQFLLGKLGLHATLSESTCGSHAGMQILQFKYDWCVLVSGALCLLHDQNDSLREAAACNAQADCWDNIFWRVLQERRLCWSTTTQSHFRRQADSRPELPAFCRCEHLKSIVYCRTSVHSWHVRSLLQGASWHQYQPQHE